MALNSLDSFLSWLVEGLPGFPPTGAPAPPQPLPPLLESFVPELSRPATSPLPQTPPQTSPTTSASPAILLPPLEAPDERFLGYNPSLAGRAVVVELMARPDDSRAVRQKLWEQYQREGNNIQELGLAAQTLERVGVNWRQAKKPSEVLAAFRALPQGTTN